MSTPAFFKRAASDSGILRGFTLIEILVALLVLSVGLLGLAALQREILQHQKAIGLASDALWLAEDLRSRCRANPGAAYRLAPGSQPPPEADCASSACSPAEWAAADLSTWHQNLLLHLPLIERDVEGAGEACRVRLRYRLPGGRIASTEVGP